MPTVPKKISALPAATIVQPSDLFVLNHDNGDGTYTTQKAVATLISAFANGNFIEVTDTITLTDPLPNVIWYNFTDPGKVITLPPANVPGISQPAGKWIIFYPAPTNTENFDINTADGNTYDTVIGSPAFAIFFGSNSNIRGTPIGNIKFFNGASLGTLASQNADSVNITDGIINASITVNQDATSGLQPVTYQQLNRNVNISVTTHTLSSTDVFSRNFCSNVAGCTITVNFSSLQNGEESTFQNISTNAFVEFVDGGSAALNSFPANCFKIPPNGIAKIGRLNGAYYVNGDLTA